MTLLAYHFMSVHNDDATVASHYLLTAQGVSLFKLTVSMDAVDTVDYRCAYFRAFNFI